MGLTGRQLGEYGRRRSLERERTLKSTGSKFITKHFFLNLQGKVESHFVYKCCNVFPLNLFIQVLGASYICSIQLTFIPRGLPLRQSIRYSLKALEEGIKGIF